jgi:hypothetical protein
LVGPELLAPLKKKDESSAPGLARRGRVCYLRAVVFPQPRASAGLLVVAALLLVAPGASAHGAVSAVGSSATPPAPPGDGATAEKLLVQVEGRAKAAGPAAIKVVAESVHRARTALERARGARVSGDAPHARMLDGLALEWAETARDLQRAATAESSAADLGKKARDVATQVERARVLLADTQDRRGRAAAELEKLEVQAKEAAVGARTAEDRRIEKKKTAAPAPAPASKPAPKKPAKQASP